MKKSDKEAEASLKRLIEMDFPIKVQDFISYDKSSDTAITGQFSTTTGEVYIFYVDFNNGRPTIQRYI